MPNDLSKLIRKYADDDNPATAMENVSEENYNLMVEYEGGVPSGVMFAANVTASERIAKLLGGMLIDVATKVHGWTPEEAATQEGLTRWMIELLAADAMRDTLVAMQPKEKPDAGGPVE